MILDSFIVEYHDILLSWTLYKDHSSYAVSITQLDTNFPNFILREEFLLFIWKPQKTLVWIDSNNPFSLKNLIILREKIELYLSCCSFPPHSCNTFIFYFWIISSQTMFCIIILYEHWRDWWWWSFKEYLTFELNLRKCIKISSM